MLASLGAFLGAAFPLTAKGGKSSRAKYQDCLYCGGTVRNALVHCLAGCPFWTLQRLCCKELLGISDVLSKDELALRLLHVGPEHQAFPVFLRWCKAMDEEATDCMRSGRTAGESVLFAACKFDAMAIVCYCVLVLCTRSQAVLVWPLCVPCCARACKLCLPGPLG